MTTTAIVDSQFRYSAAVAELASRGAGTSYLSDTLYAPHPHLDDSLFEKRQRVLIRTAARFAERIVVCHAPPSPSTRRSLVDMATAVGVRLRFLADDIRESLSKLPRHDSLLLQGTLAEERASSTGLSRLRETIFAGESNLYCLNRLDEFMPESRTVVSLDRKPAAPLSLQRHEFVSLAPSLADALEDWFTPGSLSIRVTELSRTVVQSVALAFPHVAENQILALGKPVLPPSSGMFSVALDADGLPL